MRHRRWLYLAGALILAVAGCRPTHTPPPVDPAVLRASSRLSNLRARDNPWLRDELARIEGEGGTPEQVEQRFHSPAAPGVAPRAVEDLPAPAAWDLPLNSDQRLRALERMARLYPEKRFSWNAVELQSAAALRRQLADYQNAFRDQLNRPDFRFPLDYLAGPLANLGFLEDARLASRLEGIEVAERLDEGDPAAAMPALERMFRIADQLSQLWHVTSRVEAVHLRAAACEALDACLRHQRATRDVYARASQLLAGQLAAWPADENAWIGDRAQGLQTFELVSTGQWLSLLTLDELVDLRQNNKLEAFARAIERTWESELQLYLETMRKIIDSCRQPYLQRRDQLRQIAADLAALRDTPQEPIFAANYMLADFATAQRFQAEDRARCAAWANALALALGEKQLPYPVDPLTGQPYPVAVNDEAVVVRVPGLAGATVQVRQRH